MKLGVGVKPGPGYRRGLPATSVICTTSAVTSKANSTMIMIRVARRIGSGIAARLASDL